MVLIAPELGNLFHPGVKRKSNRTGKLRAKANRVARGATEVMVKITGFGKGAGHVKAHLDYITRNGKMEMENDRGEVFTGKEDVKELFSDWKKDFSDGERRKNQRDTMHMVLSMPEGTDSESVKRAVREFTKDTFGGKHEYVFVLHTDEPHPHCHVTVKCKGFDGTRLNPRKADLQQWREGFADKLRDQGVDAEATPRGSRGVVKKAEKSVLRHIERGDKSHEPRVAKVKAAKIKEAAKELTSDVNTPHPWEEVIKKKQQEIRNQWLVIAEALNNENTKITFNQKEAHNDRPDYTRISDAHVHRGQRAAALYQSNYEESGRQEPPRSVASLRDMPSINVVQRREGTQMLLQPDAFNRMERRETRTDTEMRRAGIGDNRAQDKGSETGGSGARTGGTGGTGINTVNDSKSLASAIRGFVERMPPVITERQQLKQELFQKFTKQPEKIRAIADAALSVNSKNKDVSQELNSKPVVNKDIER